MSSSNAVSLMRTLGLDPDPWQIEVLDTAHSASSSTAAARPANPPWWPCSPWPRPCFVPFTKVLLLSRSHRQSTELFRIVTGFYDRLGHPDQAAPDTAEELSLTNGSRIVCLPCKEETIRGYSDVSLLIIDEAARVPDDLYRAVRPMLATSNGRLICLSTPYGKRGFFYDCWANGGDDWLRIEIPADQGRRITPEFLAQERRSLGESWYPPGIQLFLRSPGRPGLPRFRPQLGGDSPRPICTGKLVGGIDFGFRNPFAAIWGTLGTNDTLCLTGEHYSREKPLSYHAAHLPPRRDLVRRPRRRQRNRRIASCRLQGPPRHQQPAPGIAAVRARLEDGALRLLSGRCPNLLAEAGLYRYGTPAEGWAAKPLSTSTITPWPPCVT